MQFTVAIDGPAAAGKGTIAKAVAERFGFAHLDTGLLYRAVGKRAITQGRGVIDEGVAELIAQSLAEKDLKQDGLRTVLVARASSRVAAMPGVRQALAEFQKEFARREGGAVLDGRDIGTVICPQAEVKIFVTASDTTRAQRRFDELIARGEDTTVERVASDLSMRDARDSQRDTAPLVQAEDAVLLDTTEMGIDEAVSVAVKHVEAALAG
ncbi:MAG: (d)CMP kinase [Pseudomonadota bacterium]